MVPVEGSTEELIIHATDSGNFMLYCRYRSSLITSPYECTNLLPFVIENKGAFPIILNFSL